MTRFSSSLLVASSLAWAVAASAASRPHYGGTLHIAARGTPQALNPASLASSGCRNLAGLVFETLVELDRQGRPQPLLASSWQSEPGNQRWRFLLRSGVLFHGGETVDAALVAASLRNSNPEWKVLAAGDTIVIETASPDPELAAELALARNAIARPGTERPGGTGPFAITEWVAGKHLRLTANPKYWASPPFLEQIDVEFGRAERDQIMNLDLGKLDVAEVGPENIGRARAQNRKVFDSEPGELMALVFAHDPRSPGETLADTALSASLDRAAINDVVLQGGGEPAGALLPNWLSGYGFVFPGATNAERTRQLRPQLGPGSPLRLGYDGSDPLAGVIAQRILLNARDAGITLEITSSSTFDLRLMRLPIPSLDPYLALGELARGLGLPRPQFHARSVGELYSAEKELLQSHRIIPLVHLRSAVALRSNIHGWSELPDGSWELGNVWLSPTEQP